MMVWVTSSVMMPMTVAKVKVPTSHSKFIRLHVHAFTSPMTVTPARRQHAAHIGVRSHARSPQQRCEGALELAVPNVRMQPGCCGIPGDSPHNGPAMQAPHAEGGHGLTLSCHAIYIVALNTSQRRNRFTSFRPSAYNTGCKSI